MGGRRAPRIIAAIRSCIDSPAAPPAAAAPPRFFLSSATCSTSSASARSFEARHHITSEGLQAAPEGRSASPVSGSTRQRGWQSTSAAGLKSLPSPAAARTPCCSRCIRFWENASCGKGAPEAPSGGAEAACVSTRMVLNQTARPSASETALSIAASAAPPPRGGVSMRST